MFPKPKPQIRSSQIPLQELLDAADELLEVKYVVLDHLEEAKNWIEECIREELPASTLLEENFRNGVYFAKLGHFCAPNVVPKRKIFDPDHKKWKATGLHFKHTDNINYFLTALKEIGLPEVNFLRGQCLSKGGP